MSSNIKKKCSHVKPSLNFKEFSVFTSAEPPKNIVRCVTCTENAEVEVLWLCLTCFQINCGRNDYGHALEHFKESKHALVLGLWSLEVWCYVCDEYILGPGSEADIKRGERLVLESCQEKIINFVNRAKKKQTSRKVSSASADLTLGTTRRDGTRIPGLVNLGNTCFFNSTLQCLLYTNCIRSSILETLSATQGLGPTWGGFSHVVEASEHNMARINPQSLFDALSAKYKSYKSMRQQDAHELLRRLLDEMQQEERTGPVHRVNDWFKGQLVSVIVCDRCGETSSTIEPFYDLSLPIKFDNQQRTWNSADPLTRRYNLRSSNTTQNAVPQVETFAITDSKKRAQVDELLARRTLHRTLSTNHSLSFPSSTTTLDQCLENFMGVEVLEGDNSRLCEKCVAQGLSIASQKSYKRYFFHALPKVLVLHLKRFCLVPMPSPKSHHRFAKMTKLEQKILFDNKLNLKPLLAPSFLVDASSTPNSKTTFELVGVVQHYGTLSAGHYTAFVRHPAKDLWYYASDTKTRLASWEEVAQSPAYILFYEQSI